MAKLIQSPFFRIVIAQFIATILASASCLVLGKVAVYSALLGGLVCVAPGLTVLAMSIRPAASGSSGIGNVLRGEAGKFALSIMLFALIFTFVQPINVLVFFGTFVGLQLLYAIVPLVEAKRLENWSGNTIEDSRMTDKVTRSGEGPR